jgi:hypothetical protein
MEKPAGRAGGLRCDGKSFQVAAARRIERTIRMSVKHGPAGGRHMAKKGGRHPFFANRKNPYCVFCRGSSFGLTYVRPHGPVLFSWTTVSSSI